MAHGRRAAVAVGCLVERILVCGRLVGSMGRDGRAGQLLLCCRIIVGVGADSRGSNTQLVIAGHHVAQAMRHGLVEKFQVDRLPSPVREVSSLSSEFVMMTLTSCLSSAHCLVFLADLLRG